MTQPVVSPSTVTAPNPSRPDASAEPVLAVDEIQGNSLAGFNKHHQTLLFGTIDSDVDRFRLWLHEYARA